MSRDRIITGDQASTLPPGSAVVCVEMDGEPYRPGGLGPWARIKDMDPGAVWWPESRWLVLYVPDLYTAGPA